MRRLSRRPLALGTEVRLQLTDAGRRHARPLVGNRGERVYIAGGIAAGLVAVAGIGFSLNGSSGGRTGGTGSPK